MILPPNDYSLQPTSFNMSGPKSATEIREYLITKGVIPTTEEAKKIFWSHGPDWWKQIIDGSQHHHGEMVFDLGLHGGHTEPGYIDSIKTACEFFTNHFDEKFSLSMYEQIHLNACSHFSLRSNKAISGIACQPNEINNFRSQEERAGSGASIEEKEFVETESMFNAIKKAKRDLLEALSIKDDPEYLEADEYSRYNSQNDEVKNEENASTPIFIPRKFFLLKPPQEELKSNLEKTAQAAKFYVEKFLNEPNINEPDILESKLKDLETLLQKELLRIKKEQANGVNMGERELKANSIFDAINNTRINLSQALEAIRDDSKYMNEDEYSLDMNKLSEKTKQTEDNSESEFINNLSFRKYYKLKPSPEELESNLNAAIQAAKSLVHLDSNDPVALIEALSKSETSYNDKLLSLMHNSVDKLNAHFSFLKEKYQLNSPFISCAANNYDYRLTICYEEQPSQQELKDLSTKMIENFVNNLEKLQKETYEKFVSNKEDCIISKKNYQESVIPLIANLYAELDWAHPWIDGQGRTDIIVLNGLLCLEGLHPCILDNPYFSTSNSLEDWIEYLKNGLDKFNTAG